MCLAALGSFVSRSTQINVGGNVGCDVDGLGVGPEKKSDEDAELSREP